MLAENFGPDTRPHLPGVLPSEHARPAFAMFSPVTDMDRRKLDARMLHSISGGFVLLDGPMIPWCGTGELALLSLLVFDHKIDRIESRPVRVSVTVGGRQVSRIPALRLTMGPYKISVDVASATPNPDTARAISDAYESISEGYHVFSRAEVQAQPRLSNARLVLCHRSHRPNPEAEVAVFAQVSHSGRHSVRSIIEALPGRSDVRETVFAMCARRRLAVDLWAADPLDMLVKLAPAARWLP